MRSAPRVAPPRPEHLRRESLETRLRIPVAREAGQRTSPICIAQPGRDHERADRIYAGIIRHWRRRTTCSPSITTPAIPCGIASSMHRFLRQRRNAREASPALPAASSASYANRCSCLRRRRRAEDIAAASARQAKVYRWKSHDAMEAPRCVVRRPSLRHAAVAEVCSRADTQDLFTLCRATEPCTPSVRSRAVDLERPAPFLPPNARYSDLTAIGSMLYTSTSNGCGGVANGVWAITLDPKNKIVSSWKTNGGSPVGNLAFTPGGKILVAIGPGKTTAGGYANAIVALDAKTLQPIDWFTSPSAEFVTTPVVINHGGRELVAAATRDAIFLLDAACARRCQSLDAAVRSADRASSSPTPSPRSNSLPATPGCSCLAHAGSSLSGLR